MKKIRCPCKVLDIVKRFFGDLFHKNLVLPDTIELGIPYGKEVRAKDE